MSREDSLEALRRARGSVPVAIVMVKRGTTRLKQNACCRQPKDTCAWLWAKNKPD